MDAHVHVPRDRIESPPLSLDREMVNGDNKARDKSRAGASEAQRGPREGVARGSSFYREPRAPIAPRSAPLSGHLYARTHTRVPLHTGARGSISAPAASRPRAARDFFNARPLFPRRFKTVTDRLRSVAVQRFFQRRMRFSCP